jgi:hypothetical protein
MGSQDESSLAARRARLRGSLAKQALPPDPYGQASMAPAKNPEKSNQEAITVADDFSEADYGFEDHSTAPPQASAYPSTNKNGGGQPLFAPADLNYSSRAETSAPITLPSSVGSTLADLEDWSVSLKNGTSNLPASTLLKAEEKTTEADSKTDYSEIKNRRGLKTEKASSPVLENESSTPAKEAKSEPAPSTEKPAIDELEVTLHNIQNSLAISDRSANDPVLDTLKNMDQAMGACAVSLSALQSTANQQTEALKNLSDLLQNQTFSELGLSLHDLIESLTAALEPMKAASEIVPAVDQLVQSMGAKIQNEPAQASKLTPDQLVMNLADQLSAGTIDPWTFKSAYMAVFPADHPADLLHRLVDLLGTARLSGNLFRAAYEAVQAPDPPRLASSATDSERTNAGANSDSLLQQLDELRKNQNDLENKMSSRETELNEMLVAKEQELQDAQKLLDSRWEEFNQRYGELSESLQKRDALIQEKDTELSRKMKIAACEVKWMNSRRW